MSLASHRCLNHAGREAAARCPACGHFYCRECVTEHGGRVLCAGCLARLTAPAAKRAHPLARILGPSLAVVGLTTAWIFFYALGAVLLALPTAWHEGTVWHQLLPANPK